MMTLVGRNMIGWWGVKDFIQCTRYQWFVWWSCSFSQFINLTFLCAGKECLSEHLSMRDNSVISRMCSLCVTHFNISHVMYICLFYGEKVLNRNAVTTHVNKGILYTRPESNKKLGVCDHFNKSTICNLPTN